MVWIRFEQKGLNGLDEVKTTRMFPLIISLLFPGLPVLNLFLMINTKSKKTMVL